MLGKKKKLLSFLLGTVLVLAGCGDSAQQGESSGSGSDEASVSSDEASASSDEASASSDEASGNTSAELQSVRIGAGSATAQLTDNALVAQNLGYLDEELESVGYQAEYIGFAGAGPAINEAFASGELDYAVYADFPLITARSNGVEVTAIGAVNQETNYALLATEASGIETAADLAGKKIIVTPGTILYKYFAELCGENQIAVDDVEIVNAMTDAQTVLASGDADGLIITYGAALMYENMGLGRVVADSTSDPEQTSGMLLVGREEFVKENPDVAKALLRALRRAAEYAQENPEKAYELMVTEATPVEVVKKTYAYDTSFEYFSPELSEEYMERAQRVYEFEKENSLLGGDVDLGEAFDSSYVDEVMAE